MGKKRMLKSTKDVNGKQKGTLFSGCVIFICKANLSITRLSMLEAKIKDNDGIITNDPNLNSLSHVILEDSLSYNSKDCLNLLKTAGFRSRINCDFVRVEWICECLKQKSRVDSKVYQVSVDFDSLEKQDAEEEEGEDPDENESKKLTDNEDDEQPLQKKFKEDLESEKYVCTQPSTSTYFSSKNQSIIEELQKLADSFRSRGDQWRAYSYEKAVSAIRNYDKEITSYEEARNLPGIGEGMAKKVMEMVDEGHIRKVSEICGDEKTKVLDLFSHVWGAGPATAQSWYQQGFRTLEDLQSKAKLTKQQKTGLKYFNEIQDRMTRDELEEIVAIVKEKVLSVNRNLKLVICGSYRRGQQTCGDVDIVLIRPDHLCSKEILVAVLNELKKIGLISDDLTTLESNGNQHKYLGLCKLPGEGRKHRRLDIFVVPECESAPAIMHFTGSALFNRSIRLLASRKGMSLSEHSLSAGVMRQGMDKYNDGMKLSTPTEESIFKHLGLEYRPPEERDH